MRRYTFDTTCADVPADTLTFRGYDDSHGYVCCVEGENSAEIGLSADDARALAAELVAWADKTPAPSEPAAIAAEVFDREGWEYYDGTPDKRRLAQTIEYLTARVASGETIASETGRLMAQRNEDGIDIYLLIGEVPGEA